MQIVESMVIRNTRLNEARSQEPKKIIGAVFCKSCGEEYNQVDFAGKDMNCSMCNNFEFLTGELANTLSGYLKLDTNGNLKKYYKDKYGRNSVIKMNSKRIIMWMLIRDGYIKADDKKIEDVISKIMLKKI